MEKMLGTLLVLLHWQLGRVGFAQSMRRHYVPLMQRVMLEQEDSIDRLRRAGLLR